MNFFTDFRKIGWYEISWKSVQWEPSCFMRSGRHDEVNGHFSHFCENAQNFSLNNLDSG